MPKKIIMRGSNSWQRSPLSPLNNCWYTSLSTYRSFLHSSWVRPQRLARLKNAASVPWFSNSFLSFVIILISVSFLLLSLPVPLSAASSFQKDTIRVWIASTAAETGVFQWLFNDFNKARPGVTVDMHIAGALEVIDQARNGRADVIITHHPPSEKLFMDDGFGARRVLIMYDEFAFFGPPQGAIVFSGVTNIREVMKRLAKEEVSFDAPSPRSGTYMKLAELWATIGIAPHWVGYNDTGTSALSTLDNAALFGNYTFADLGTYLANRRKLQGAIVPVYRDDIALRNYYSAIVISKNRLPRTNEELAAQFVDYLVSDRGQARIAAFRINNENPFIPAANLDEGLKTERLMADRMEQRRLAIFSTALSLFFLGTILLLLWVGHKRKAILLAEKKAAATAMETARAQNVFFGIISHELRTPLQTIVSSIDLLAGSRPDQGGSKVIHRLENAARRLETQMKDLADYAKLGAGKLELRKSVFDIRNLLEEVVEEYAGTAKDKGVAIACLYLHCPTQIWSDPDRIRQIVGNLLNNALKYSDQGSIQVTYKCLDDATMSLMVEDSGPGIPPDKVQAMFKPFTQLDSSQNRRYEGAGMGLAIVQGLVELLNGTIRIDSTVGRGTRIEMILPYESVDKSSTANIAPEEKTKK
ncbi:MAG: ATP-binding protein [Sulfuricaulis sp.]